jgi:sigma-B regulation protein RsbU (phosphoserine phosphatase)
MNEMRIENIPLFSSLPSHEIEVLIAVLNRTEYGADTVLFREGEPGDKFYIILSGQVEIIKTLDTAEEQVLGVRGPSDFFGEMSLLNPDGLRTASVRTSTPAQLLELGHTDFRKLLERRPALAFEMVRVLSLRLRESGNVMIRDLREKNRQLCQAYEELKVAQAQIVEQEKLEHELNLARDIQESILPKDLLSLDDFEIGARMVPARSVGGDLYGYIPLSDDIVAIAIGDVSDKGIPAAIYMALFCSLLRAEIQHGTSPSEVLLRVNRHLLDLDESAMFVTALFGLLDCRKREFSYARAGHEVPILFDRDGKAKLLDWDQGQLMGFFADLKLDGQTVTIPEGCTLLLYTDGAFDALNSEGASFGLDRLVAAAAANLGSSAQNLCDLVIDELNVFQGSSSQYDDITLVAIKSSPSAAAEQMPESILGKNNA